MKRIFIVLMLVGAAFLFASEPLVSISLNPKSAEMAQSSSKDFILGVNILEGWHINSAAPLDDYSVASSLRLDSKDAGGLFITDIRYPEGKTVATGWGGNLSLYEGSLEIPLNVNAGPDIQPGNYVVSILFTYQACNDVTCMSPETISADAVIRVSPVSGIRETAAPGQTLSEDPQNNEEKVLPAEMELSQEPLDAGGQFANKSMFLVLLLVFVMGLALNLTPCVYPLIPITMGYFIAQKDRRSPVLLAFMYVIGLAVTYSLIGTLAAFGGSMMGSLLAHPATLIFFALLMIALSLSMFGVYEFRLPSKLTQSGGGSRSGALGALVMGLTMGIVAAPCVGPFVVSLLSFVAQKGSVVTGFFTFFILALGLGVPYLLLGIFSGKIASLPRSGEWLNGVRVFFGLALIGMAIYFVLPLLSGALADLLLPVYMIIASVYYALIDRSGKNMPGFLRVKTLVAMAVLVLGVLMIRPAGTIHEPLSWENYAPGKIEQANKAGEPVIIDFYADWCNPCRELEHITFTDPDVKKKLEYFTRLKVDLTVGNAVSDEIRKAFDISGVPTIIFYGRDGIEAKELRLTGFEKPGEFEKRLTKILER